MAPATAQCQPKCSRLGKEGKSLPCSFLLTDSRLRAVQGSNQMIDKELISIKRMRSSASEGYSTDAGLAPLPTIPFDRPLEDLEG